MKHDDAGTPVDANLRLQLRGLRHDIAPATVSTRRGPHRVDFSDHIRRQAFDAVEFLGHCLSFGFRLGEPGPIAHVRRCVLYRFRARIAGAA